MSDAYFAAAASARTVPPPRPSTAEPEASAAAPPPDSPPDSPLDSPSDSLPAPLPDSLPAPMRESLPDLPPDPTPRPATSRPAGALTLVVLFAAGAAVAVGTGVYGKLHEPTGVAVNLAGFSGPLEVKVWLTTVAFVLAIVQLVSSLAMYGRLPVAVGARWWGPMHRWSGRVAFLVTVPVAIHCLYALGFQSYDTRVLAHSLSGCAFYGAFTTKMLGLSRPGMPGWFLPVLGGAVLTLLVGLWLTSSLWFFTTFGIRF